MEGETAKPQTFEEAIDQILAGAKKLADPRPSPQSPGVDAYAKALDVSYNVWYRLTDSREKMAIGQQMVKEMLTPRGTPAPADPRLGRPPGGGPFGGRHGG